MAVSSSTSRRSAIILMLLAGAPTAITLGVLGSQHDPNSESLPSFGFSSIQSLKAWSGSFVLLLVIGQLVTALWNIRKAGTHAFHTDVGVRNAPDGRTDGFPTQFARGVLLPVRLRFRP